MLEIFQSPAAAERLGAAGTFIERLPVATEILLVGASRDAADDLARRIALARGTTFGLYRASLTLRGAARAHAPVLRAGGAIPGFARAFAATLGELRRGGVRPGALGPLGVSARILAEDTHDSLRQMPVIPLDVAIEGPAKPAFVSALTSASAALVTIPAGDEATLEAAEGLGGQVGLDLDRLTASIRPLHARHERAVRVADELSDQLKQCRLRHIRQALGIER